MIQAKDIMRTDLVTVGPDETQLDIIRKLSEHNVTGLPVVDKNGGLVGIISEKDLLVSAYRMICGTYDAGVHKPAVQCMSKDVVRVRPENNLADVCQIFMNEPFRRLPVVEDGKLVGIITRKDVIRHAFLMAAEDIEQFAEFDAK